MVDVRRSIRVPIQSAGDPRPESAALFELDDWFVQIAIGILSALKSEEFWTGSDAAIRAAIDDVENQIERLVLGADMNPNDFDPEFRITDGTLEWRFNEETEWDEIGYVQGADGEDGTIPDLTVSAHTIAYNVPASVTKLGDNIDFGIPAGQPGDDGNDGSASGGSLWEPPATTSDDQLCAAAKILADVFSDRLQDNLETIDAVTTTIAQTADAILDSIGGLIPIGVPIASSIVEFGFEGVTEPIIDYVRENAYDLQARELVRNKMYCAMTVAPNLYDFFDYIDWSDSLPPLGFDFSDPVTSLFGNMGEWMEWVFNTADGTNAGWLTLAYGYFLTKTIDHLVNLDNSAKAMLGYAINTAGYGEAQDCATADCAEPEWCYVFDLTADNEYFSAANGYNNTWESGVGFPGEPSPPNQDRNFIKAVFPFNVELLEIGFSLDGNAGSSTYVWICPGSQNVDCSFYLSDTNGVNFQRTVSGIYTTFALGVEQAAHDTKVGNIIAVTLRGTGENPFGETNCE